MKIRMEGNKLRLRLTKSETEAIGKNEPVSASVPFADKDFVYEIVTEATAEQISASANGFGIKVILPAGLAAKWADSDSEISLTHRQNYPDGRSLLVLAEKDFRCLHKDRQEDSEDLFPHPKEK